MLLRIAVVVFIFILGVYACVCTSRSRYGLYALVAAYRQPLISKQQQQLHTHICACCVYMFALYAHTVHVYYEPLSRSTVFLKTLYNSGNAVERNALHSTQTYEGTNCACTRVQTYIAKSTTQVCACPWMAGLANCHISHNEIGLISIIRMHFMRLRSELSAFLLLLC